MFKATLQKVISSKDSGDEISYDLMPGFIGGNWMALIKSQAGTMKRAGDPTWLSEGVAPYFPEMV
jgi:hypothetical protein